MRDRALAALLWGLGLPLVFGGASAWKHRGEPEPWSLFFVLLPPFAALGVSVLLPRVGPHVYLAVMRAAAVVGFVLSHVLLVVFFYLVVTPLGALVRALGKSSVDLAFKSGEPPRWHAREGNPAPERYHRLF